MTVNECSTGFKNKEEYIHLPIYVGKPVWSVTYWRYSNKVEIEVGKVSMLQQKADKSWKFRVSAGGSVSDYLLSDIGCHIFLTEAEAIEEHDRIIRELNI
jgi:hypothetical protein